MSHVEWGFIHGAYDMLDEDDIGATAIAVKGLWTGEKGIIKEIVGKRKRHAKVQLTGSYKVLNATPIIPVRQLKILPKLVPASMPRKGKHNLEWYNNSSHRATRIYDAIHDARDNYDEDRALMQEYMRDGKPKDAPAEQNLYDHYRKLWVEHMDWYALYKMIENVTLDTVI
jgi:hypothetical protein